MKLKPLVFAVVLVVGIQSLSGQETTGRYLRIPYVASKHLLDEVAPTLFAQYEELSNRFVDALNARTTMDELDSLFLTEENVETYLNELFETYDDLTEEDREDETSRAWDLIDYNIEFWTQLIVGSEENDFTFVLIDFGVHVDFETSHYFLVSLVIEPISEEGPIPFLAEFFDGGLHISGLAIEPFVFN
jgi:hypothetical protein